MLEEGEKICMQLDDQEIYAIQSSLLDSLILNLILKLCKLLTQ